MKTSRKKMTGVVVSHNMKRTIVVAVSRTFRHPRYKKYLHSVKTYKVHDERDTCSVNDVVEIVETRPLSKEKKWRVIRVLGHAKNAGGESLRSGTQQVPVAGGQSRAGEDK